MNITIESPKLSTKSVTIEGYITIYTVTEIKARLADIFDNITNLNFNLNPVSKIDTAGFQLLIAIRETAKKKNIKFEIGSPSHEVKAIFHLYGESL